MGETLKEIKQRFTVNQTILENAKITLKKEFFGIDNVIDVLIENVGSWMSLNPIQEKPYIINLWGLTGTGKTSLVKRLSQLIDKSDQHYLFDMGVKYGDKSFSRGIYELSKDDEDNPVIITLDEFQHQRTIVSSGMNKSEIDEDKNRQVWELLDSGEINYYKWKGGLAKIEELHITLAKLIECGLKIKDGYITNEKDVFEIELGFQNFETEVTKNEHEGVEKELPEEKVLAIEENMYNDLMEYGGEEFGFNLLKDVREFVLKLDENETVEFLKRVFQSGDKTSRKKFSKSLIFVLGNLDEAYNINGNFNTEISADEFHIVSKEISLPDIKKSLRERFRDEQIARLGNTHLIYPALNSKAYQDIITFHLNKIAQKINKMVEIDFCFKPSVNDFIYQEGVYPTQGVRPVLTTIQEHVKGKLNLIIAKIIEFDLSPKNVEVEIVKNKLRAKISLNDNKIEQFDFSLNTQLFQLRKNRKDDLQCIVAVHESGHAILRAVLNNRVPDVIKSVSSESDLNGFVFTSMHTKYRTKQDVMNDAVVSLGGLVAEEMIFGEDNATIGSSSDVKQLTASILDLLYNQGMGNIPIRYGKSPGFSHELTNFRKLEIQAEKIVKEAKEKAREVLGFELSAFLQLSDHLSKHPSIAKPELEIFLSKKLKSNVDFVKKQYKYKTILADRLSDLYNGNQLKPANELLALRQSQLNHHFTKTSLKDSTL